MYFFLDKINVLYFTLLTLLYSIMGLLLFLLYINDIANVSTSLLPILFAYDTNVFLTGKKH